MTTYDKRRGTTSGGAGTSSTLVAGTTKLTRTVDFSTVNSGSVTASTDMVQAIQLPANCVVHWIGAETETANTSSASVQLSCAGYIPVTAANGNLSTTGFAATSAAMFPFFNSATSTIEVVVTSGTMTAGNALLRVFAVVTPVDA